jgi:hypothetical protein
MWRTRLLIADHKLGGRSAGKTTHQGIGPTRARTHRSAPSNSSGCLTGRHGRLGALGTMATGVGRHDECSQGHCSEPPTRPPVGQDQRGHVAHERETNAMPGIRNEPLVPPGSRIRRGCTPGSFDCCILSPSALWPTAHATSTRCLATKVHGEPVDSRRDTSQGLCHGVSPSFGASDTPRAMLAVGPSGGGDPCTRSREPCRTI